MGIEKSDYHPFKFLDSMKGNNHIVLLYDNQKYADLIIARYFLNGLKKGESCIFFSSPTADIRNIEERLFASGIDVDLYKQTNSLRIYTIEGSDKNRIDLLGTLKRIRENSTSGMKPPFRFVGRTITDTGTKEGMSMGLALEKIGHKHFMEFDNSQMCYYDISKIEHSQRHKWIAGLLKNHHQVIYASEPDKAVAFETALLENENE